MALVPTSTTPTKVEAGAVDIRLFATDPGVGLGLALHSNNTLLAATPFQLHICYSVMLAVRRHDSTIAPTVANPTGPRNMKYTTPNLSTG